MPVKFVNFALRWDFLHDTSTPHYLKSNGLAERTVRTIKWLLKKAFASNEDLYLALLNWTITLRKDGLSLHSHQLIIKILQMLSS